MTLSEREGGVEKEDHGGSVSNSGDLGFYSDSSKKSF